MFFAIVTGLIIRDLAKAFARRSRVQNPDISIIHNVAYRSVATQRPRNKQRGAAVAMQLRGKHVSAIIELLLETVLCNPLLGSYNS
jgi:hypothetical protein